LDVVWKRCLFCGNAHYVTIAVNVLNISIHNIEESCFRFIETRRTSSHGHCAFVANCSTVTMKRYFI
jgi:hypothetical protein